MRKMVQHFGAEFEAWNELSLEMLAQEQQSADSVSQFLGD